MNVDWEFLHRVVNEDASCRFMYQGDGGKSCFIGGLALALGVSLPLGSDNACGLSGLPAFAGELAAQCGLSHEELCILQQTNDAFPNIRARRGHLHQRLYGMQRLMEKGK